MGISDLPHANGRCGVQFNSLRNLRVLCVSAVMLVETDTARDAENAEVAQRVELQCELTGQSKSDIRIPKSEIAFWSLLPLVDHSILHHKHNAFHVLDISQRIAPDGDDVRPLAGCQRSEVLVPP